MLFNSLQFFVFFIIVYGLYLVMNHKWQNRLLLVASYIFYGAWDWRFLSLIWVSTLLDYVCGLKIQNSENLKIKRIFLGLSIAGNLGILGFFKYFDFFAQSLQDTLGFFGMDVSFRFLHIILPVGISFYTFQTMSYTLDIYRGQLKATRKFLDFATFVAFFPQLVAGPIERASHLLPQVLNKRKLRLDWIWEGCYLIFWGLFLKVFVADNLAKLVDPVFSSPGPYNGPQVLLALYAFAFQIFGDFAGYSNIARGLGRLMGFDIMVNFNLPYFATNPSDFWSRWHISLSSWLRDYLYIPLGGNRRGTFMTYRNLALTMLLGGLWHGAAWTFVVWGAYQGLLLIGHRLMQPLLRKIPAPKNVIVRRVWFIVRVVFFFHLVCVGWLLFRAQSMRQVGQMLYSLTAGFKVLPETGLKTTLGMILFIIGVMGVIQVFQFVKKDFLCVLKAPALVRAGVYIVIFYLLAIYGVTGSHEFIYFQF